MINWRCAFAIAVAGTAASPLVAAPTDTETIKSTMVYLDGSRNLFVTCNTATRARCQVWVERDGNVAHAVLRPGRSAHFKNIAPAAKLCVLGVTATIASCPWTTVKPPGLED